MIATTTNTPPQARELINVLRKEFSDKYSYSIFGTDSEQRVVVSRFWFTLAQITVHQNGLSVERPSAIGVFLTNVIRYMTGTVMPLAPYRKKLQKHLAAFLNRKYKS